MSHYQHIVDNRCQTAADYLRNALNGAHSLSLVSAYFSIYGYEALEASLQDLSNVRFLYGDRGSVEDVDPNQQAKSFLLKDGRLDLGNTLVQKALARRCANWIKRDAVDVRAVTRSNFMHGKMYLTEGDDIAPKGLIGSSNFTKSGLGEGTTGNLEINLAVEDAAVLAEMKQWFNEIWDSKWTEDVKPQLLAQLERVGADHSPRDVYFKTLYEIFRSEVDDLGFGDLRNRVELLSETAIWNALYEFQKDGVRSAIYRLQNYNGCIIADSVGLGKTYTALAVIRYYELRNERVLVLCPKKLNENWLVYQAFRNDPNNPFGDDRFGFTVLSHSDLSRTRGQSNGVDLANFNWSNFDLIVIDESHNFRNDLGARYRNLVEWSLQPGANTKVLMLSATPVNTAITDLKSQIKLMASGELAQFRNRNEIGIAHPERTLDAAQRRFADWEKQAGKGRRDKNQLIDDLSSEFKRLLDATSLSRSRSHVETYYAAEMDRIGRFPKRLANQEETPATDTERELVYEDLANDISGFSFALYQPWNHAKLASRRVENYEKFLAGMMRTNFLKRLESSAHSLTLTLDRTIQKMDTMLDRIARYQAGDRSDLVVATRQTAPETDEDLDETTDETELISQELKFEDMKLDEWKRAIERDRRTLEAAKDKVSVIKPERDAKLKLLIQAIKHRHGNPTRDDNGQQNRKLIVFTTFKDTAQYLYDQLTRSQETSGIRTAMVAGDVVRHNRDGMFSGAPKFHDVLNHFAPVARNSRERIAADDEFDLLIATDCISEGQNLQDCDRILNYDIHWNPVRLTQRFGRIDRIGSKAQSVKMINYWPTDDMEQWINLKQRVLARMMLVDIAATGDDDPFATEAEQELSLRGEQFKALRDNSVNIDELDDSLSLGDFTLDHFRMQLMQFIRANRKRLEEMPLGVYAITTHREQLGFDSPTVLDPGVIWCFRQTSAQREPGTTTPSPVYPCYLVYVKDDGQIRYGCANAERILHLFEACSADKHEPITELCDWFDEQTDRGQDMSHYNKLLNECTAHVKQEYNSAIWKQLGPDGNPSLRLPEVSQTPESNDSLELVSWLVIKE